MEEDPPPEDQAKAFTGGLCLNPKETDGNLAPSSVPGLGCERENLEEGEEVGTPLSQTDCPCLSRDLAPGNPQRK